MTVEKPFALKVGPSLSIDDIPDHIANKAEVIRDEQKFWEQRDGDKYRAPIDTTFALYRPLSGLNRSRAAEAYSLAQPYSLRHLPLYEDSACPTEEELFYRNACIRPTMWTSASNKSVQQHHFVENHGHSQNELAVTGFFCKFARIIMRASVSARFQANK